MSILPALIIAIIIAAIIAMSYFGPETDQEFQPTEENSFFDRLIRACERATYTCYQVTILLRAIADILVILQEIAEMLRMMHTDRDAGRPVAPSQCRVDADGLESCSVERMDVVREEVILCCLCDGGVEGGDRDDRDDCHDTHNSPDHSNHRNHSKSINTSNHSVGPPSIITTSGEFAHM
ncbi:uncharacterized protein BO97DRAFT_417421 [Aspergillus homomorphus CBS 101889]|uniref:Uncharacterized protein n=1 Tax=Aspergillus homomorphus (strain CBS 101889) TaxID=1450537 RepID=A0A395HLV8_ASPHC|nr:hypothetical protein BO97DRAFT_417421 [Aspergillus homomorphus CBS 101889]RAL08750.1 hypothetical protein BO97DRAFT_417421 [Aspergillus homomorphus CBS 101889]